MLALFKIDGLAVVAAWTLATTFFFTAQLSYVAGRKNYRMTKIYFWSIPFSCLLGIYYLIYPFLGLQPVLFNPYRSALIIWTAMVGVAPKLAAIRQANDETAATEAMAAILNKEE